MSILSGEDQLTPDAPFAAQIRNRCRSSALILGLAFAILSSFAVADDRSIEFDIPAQALDKALNTFRTAAGVQIFTRPR